MLRLKGLTQPSFPPMTEGRPAHMSLRFEGGAERCRPHKEVREQLFISLREPQALRRRFKAYRNEKDRNRPPPDTPRIFAGDQAPTPFHILWRHPDNASFTEQGDEYL